MSQTISQIGIACTGCGACEQICPQNCIEMKANEEGFLYPNIDIEKCVSCGVCLSHCPNTKDMGLKKRQSFYGLQNLDKKRLFQSASGGASDVFANWIVKQGGYVYGAVYGESFEVVHQEISKDDELWKMQSSKYVQSTVGNCYRLAKERLENGVMVLFTGTPCQIAGLYGYLGNKRFEKLYTMDLICHGVPSPKLFRKYTKWQEKQMRGKLIEYNFRSKEKRGWGTQYYLKTKTKTKTGPLFLDHYGKAFMQSECYRESCYQCRYANMNRVSDITVGDFWGIWKCRPDFLASSKGVSSVIVNTEQGEKLFEAVRSRVTWFECSEEEIKAKQGNLLAPSARPANRAAFYNGLDREDFIERIKIGIQLKNRIKMILPVKVVQLGKRWLP